MPAQQQHWIRTAYLSGSTGTVAAGYAVISTGTSYVVATSANRTSYGRAEGVTLTAGDDDDTAIEIQCAGTVPNSITGLGTGSASWVRVSSTGTLERCTPGSGDDLVGKCNARGDLFLDPGVWDSSNYAGGGGAPAGASYVTLGTDATLTSERVLTAGSGISITDAGAGSTVTVAASGIVNANIDAAAAIAVTKLATGAAGTVLKGGASNAFGAVVNADVDAAAAIAGTKIAPDFGAQAVTTTGAGSFASVAVPNAGAISSKTAGGSTVGLVLVDASDIVRYGYNGAANPSGYVFHEGNSFGWYSGGAYRFYADTSSFQFATPRIGLSAPYASDGQANVALSGVAYTLTAAEYSRAFIAFTGTAGVTVTFPSVADNDHAYAKDIINTCGAAVTLSNGGATTASIAGGDTKGRYWFNTSGVFGPF